MLQALYVTICVLAALSVSSQTLLRKALFGVITSSASQGLHIDSVILNSSAEQLGLRKHDLLLSLNNLPLTSNEQLKELTQGLRTGDALKVSYMRQGKTMQRATKAVMKPMERSNYASIRYDWVKFKNGYLRVIVRTPNNIKNMPCILLIPGYGCGSIENYQLSYNGVLMNEWLKNGYAVVTIEKSGLGDSYNCPPCSEVDLATDIESFDAGYRYMENLNDVDKNQLFIWGHSLGGIIAPEIAKRHSPRGVMVFGTVYRPWSEFLPEMHRVQKPLMENMTYQETEQFVRLIHKVYYEFFILKKSRKELYQIPEYRQIVETELEYKEGSELMWGRHWRFWQQLDSLNLSQSWTHTRCPVLVIQGGSDYEQCSALEPVLIEQTVNAQRPGTATSILIDDLDHFMMKSVNYKEALENFRTQAYTKGNFNYRISDTTIAWLHKLTR